MDTAPPLALENAQLLVAGGVGGLLTWICLNRRPARGDYAAVAYLAALASVYLVARQSHILANPLSTTCTFFAFYTLSALLCTVAYRLSPFHPLASYPGPLLWRISSLRLGYLSYTGRRHFVLDDLHAIYGPFVRIGPNTLSINTLSALSLYSQQYDMEKSESYNTPGHLPVVAIFFRTAVNSLKLHAERKRIWMTAFTNSAMANYFPSLEKRTNELISCFLDRQARSPQGTVDFSECVCHWSYDFVGDMAFAGCNNLELMKRGDPDKLIYGGKLATILLDSFGQSPWLMDLMWHLPGGKSMVRLRDVSQAMMQKRLEVGKNAAITDITSYLMKGDPISGRQISQADLEGDAAVALQGGSDNSASIISVAFYFMLFKRKYYQLLQDEVDTAFPDAAGPLDNSQLAALPVLNGVIWEALRLGSPFYLPRIVPEGGVTVEGRYIPGGTDVAAAAYSQHVSPSNFYPAPLEFLPERWQPDGLGPGTITEKNAISAFSSGPHSCPAKVFAWKEMRHIVARLALTFDMELAPGFDIPAYRERILNMRTTVLDPLMVRVTKRAGVV